MLHSDFFAGLICIELFDAQWQYGQAHPQDKACKTRTVKG